ncbi:hypothetical protein LX16_1110 [Stackebrandtia albiflava]|uniref:Uncharacterized protein n=1 Tax=Stackebrandtia albiflava TaxID=406432 RepID=A0A562VC57_9ACTN|nr:hypothetical protein [Stackebrandtia albiflava]TWJ15407.1 hypothetical protein LX16_1110 [Stackebrandtia albiflava]
MARTPADRRRTVLLAGAAVQTVVLFTGVYLLAATDNGVAGAVAVGSWSALGLLGACLYLARPLVAAELDPGAEAARDADQAVLVRVCGLVPLAQVPVVGGMVWILTAVTGFDVGYFLVAEGVGGAVGSFLLLFLVAYLCELLGVLVLLLIGFPLMLLAGALNRIRKGDRTSFRAALIGLIVSAVLPMSVAAVLAVDGPSGRGGGLGRLLVVLGVESERYEVVSDGWLWTARALTLLFVVVVLLVVAAEKTSRRATRRRSPR